MVDMTLPGVELELQISPEADDGPERAHADEAAPGEGVVASGGPETRTYVFCLIRFVSSAIWL
jgi:hypothetical protein